MKTASSSHSTHADDIHSRSAPTAGASSRTARSSHVSISSNKRSSMNKGGSSSSKMTHGVFRRAVPHMPRALAYICFILNLILPGTGTLISAFAVFCCGRHDYGKNIIACLYNLLAAVLQCATIFLLVGWIWSVRWGILFVQLSGNKNVVSQPAPFYVRRQSSVDNHTQPFITHMVAPRVPPVLEDTNEMDMV